VAALVSQAFALVPTCSRRHEASLGTEAARAPTIVLETPPTTSPRIAMANLDAEISDRLGRAARGEMDAAVELVPRLLMRARFEGRVADLIAADETSARVLATRQDAGGHMARAEALAAIHAFTESSAELDAAARLGADATVVARARCALLVATGHEDEAATALAIDETSPPSDLAMRAGAAALLGDAAGADALFESARRRYHDVSPFAVAWMDFERARALEREGDARRAKAYLREAVTVLPTFAHAATHLAALEPPELAWKDLETLSATTDDPDVPAAQADALRRSGRAEEARAMAARASARYAEVLQRLPLAYADHAASFYLGMGGDIPRALELARRNAANRPTDEALELWLSAAQAAGSRGAICSAATGALGRRHAPSSLRDRAAAAARGCP
jgi:hypothetical protein